MKVTLIVTTYNWPEALILTLKSILQQTKTPDEVIVADDGSGLETRDVVNAFAAKAPFPIIHSWQKDDGFRLAMSRNKAIALAKGDYIVVVDGDLILHPKFLHDHLANARRGLFLQGGRVLLGPKVSKKLFEGKLDPTKISIFVSDLQNRKNAWRNTFLSKLFSKTGRSLKGIKGCNFSLFREDIIHVNGFDNDFIGWGREDSEFVIRLFNAGIKRKNLKFTAVAFHLHHPEHERSALPENDRRLTKSIEEKTVRCENGIDRFLNTPESSQ